MSTLLTILLVGTAWSAGVESEIDTIDAAADDLAQKTSVLEADTRPGAYLDSNEAVVRFQDCLFLHLIGQDSPAAEGFFALVTTGALADAGMHRDAEWYLAESLVGLGNFQTAAARFQLIVEDQQHPFRDDAVRRLLELYAEMGDDEAFRKLYDAEIVPGRVKPTGLITYSLAKSMYKQGDRASARQYFLQVPVDNAWYGRARYFLGTLDVADGNLDSAKTYFDEVSKLSVQTGEDRDVHDLALLALGRIAYHLHDFEAAFVSYNAISGDSKYQDDRLYELVWTSIRREDWHDALNNVEIFLLAYPEHEKAAQMRLLEGHLNYQERNWDEALLSYEQVIQDYSGVRDRFDQLARSGPEADEQVSQFLVAANPDLPPYALSMMKADPDLGRALGVFGDLEAERADIEQSEQLISELQAFLAGSGAVSTYEQATANAHAWRLRSLGHRLTLLSIEERWLDGVADANAKAALPDLTRRREAAQQRYGELDARMSGATDQLDAFERQLAEYRADVDNARRDSAEKQSRVAELKATLSTADASTRAERQAQIAQLETEQRDAEARVQDANRKIAAMTAPDVTGDLPVAEIQALSDEVSSLATSFASARVVKPGEVVPDRADADHRSLVETFDRLGRIVDTLQGASRNELGAVRERFEAEVAAVSAERADHSATSAEAHTVTRDLTRAGFGRLEDFFADSILRADMGIVDVYWSQKLELDDQLVQLKEEKDQTVAELERRFTLIREKMGEGP